MGQQRAPISDGGEQLLRELVESVPVSSEPSFRPVALRSVAMQRRQALAGYAVRNRFDTMLFHAEWVMGLIVVLAIGGFVGRDYVDSWFYPAPVRAAPPAVVQSVTLPVVKKMLVASTAKSAPRIALKPVAADLVIQTSRDAVHALHPELGLALPSSISAYETERALDAVAPSERYVRPTPVEVPEVLTETSAEPTPDVAAAILPPVYLEAPAVGLQADAVEVFLQDGVWQVADFAVGYLHGTGQPGIGNLVMAGHKGIRGAVFANLEALQPGDEVFVDTAEQRFRYQVRETRRVWPSEVEVMYPTQTPTLTLLTCTNWDLQRYIVVADLVDSAPRTVSTGS